MSLHHVYFVLYFRPWARSITMGHDSYHCQKYQNSVAFPVQRQPGKGNFVGSVVSLNNSIQFTEKYECPMACRPKNHSDWAFCWTWRPIFSFKRYLWYFSNKKMNICVMICTQIWFFQFWKCLNFSYSSIALDLSSLDVFGERSKFFKNPGNNTKFSVKTNLKLFYWRLAVGDEKAKFPAN